MKILAGIVFFIFCAVVEMVHRHLERPEMNTGTKILCLCVGALTGTFVSLFILLVKEVHARL